MALKTVKFRVIIMSSKNDKKHLTNSLVACNSWLECKLDLLLFEKQITTIADLQGFDNNFKR